MARNPNYPPASRAQWYGGGRYGGSKMTLDAPVVVLHTTEGNGWPAYGGGSMAPTLTFWPVSPRQLLWRQHFPINESGRALQNLVGGVNTNTAGAVQVELVGTCDEATARKLPGIMYWPAAPDWALQGVADFLSFMHDEFALPLVSTTRPWLAYGKDARRPGVWPASYGASPARMSFAEWENFSGICGHQHVPENDHGDPGNLNIGRLLQLAKGAVAPTPPKPTTPKPPATKPPATKPTPLPSPKDPAMAQPAIVQLTDAAALVVITERGISAIGDESQVPSVRKFAECWVAGVFSKQKAESTGWTQADLAALAAVGLTA